MEGYLGESIVDIQETEWADYTAGDWALLWIEEYNGLYGNQQKNWFLDQVARILHGTKVITTLAEWDNGHKEYRFKLDAPSENYLKWVELFEYY